ncbi:hypothetical protein GCM10009574_078190 [Streptomyces asiaticus]|uniref:Glutaminase n=2 Tax=Streptomyces rhizosphaericus TaxID=114699 RepID=A0ABN1NZX7_9ACTN
MVRGTLGSGWCGWTGCAVTLSLPFILMSLTGPAWGIPQQSHLTADALIIPGGRGLEWRDRCIGVSSGSTRRGGPARQVSAALRMTVLRSGLPLRTEAVDSQFQQAVGLGGTDGVIGSATGSS